MAWFKKKRPAPAPPRTGRVPRELQHPADWIMVPFRFAETARVSIHTIGCQDEIPASVRFWIAQWLCQYNHQLVEYMQEYYGPEILPLLDSITREVTPHSDEDDSAEDLSSSASWEHWEKQFGEQFGEG